MSARIPDGVSFPRRKRPKYGEETQATTLLDILRNTELDQQAAIAAITEAYPSLAGERLEVSKYVYDGRRALSKRETVRAERLTFTFIKDVHPSPQVEVEPPAKKTRWWQRKGGEQ